jgi:NMD protein affecting ribosome stability and mRNA decay
MAQTKKMQVNEVIDTAVELTQKSAQTTLNGAVQTAELTENYVQGMYKVGYDANYEALKVAKNYWDATTQIRQDWLKLFAQTGENLINATANMELPLQKEISEFGKGVVNNVQETVENLTAKTKTAAK